MKKKAKAVSKTYKEKSTGEVYKNKAAYRMAEKAEAPVTKKAELKKKATKKKGK